MRARSEAPGILWSLEGFLETFGKEAKSVRPGYIYIYSPSKSRERARLRRRDLRLSDLWETRETHESTSSNFGRSRRRPVERPLGETHSKGKGSRLRRSSSLAIINSVYLMSVDHARARAPIKTLAHNSLVFRLPDRSLVPLP